MQIGGTTLVQKLRKLTVERLITFVLILLMYGVVILSVVELGRRLITQVLTAPGYMLGIDEVLNVLGMFMVVLIAIELLDTIRAYLDEHVVHAEVVMEAAMIAVARKVILLDIKQTPAVTVLGIAAIILALSGGYYILKRIHQRKPDAKDGA